MQKQTKIARKDLALLWELPAAGKPVKKALSTSRAMEHLDRLLAYHGLTYVDAFVMELPLLKGGEVMREKQRFPAMIRWSTMRNVELIKLYSCTVAELHYTKIR